MGKKIVKGSSSNGKSTMKEALKSIGIKKSKDVNDRKLKKKDFRDILWNYPIYISKLFKSLIPLSYIVLFAIVGISISFLLDSEVVARILNGSGSENTFTEGSVGAISTFNPLFVSVNYVDKAVQELVFDRFIYISKDGEPLPGIAESWSVSSDRLEYRFKIKEDVFWHNGTPLTIEDILFTFDTAKALSEEFGFDSVGVSLIGVDVSKDGGDVVFKLSEPNPTFFEAVSLFIVPKSRLENVDLSQMAFDMFS